MRRRPLLALISLLPAVDGVRANQIWKRVDADGVLHFSSQRESADSTLLLSHRPMAEGPPVAISMQQAAGILENISRSENYRRAHPVLEQAASAHGLEYELLKAVVIAESGFNEKAVSPKGAIGLMQIMPATASRYGIKPTNGQTIRHQLSDPAINVTIGSRYLLDLQRYFPERLDLVLAAYNAGENAVRRAGRKIPAYRETQNYVSKVLSLYEAQKAAPNPHRLPT